MRLDLNARAVATQKTVNKYNGSVFAYGKNDCLRMLRSHLVNMGHQPPRIPRYSSAVTGLKRLRELGHKNMKSLLDSLLVEIAPASAMIGDVVLLKGDGALDAIGLCVGNKIACWHEESEKFCMVVVPVDNIEAAYRG